MNLLSYKSNRYSQNGEDGIICEIFNKIGTTTKICCEFGAWDGIHLSNCRSLILNGWSALMIEGQKKRFDDLVSNYSDKKHVICVNKFVDAELNSLASICAANNIEGLDFLSIDIDGLDYEIFESLDFFPRVICIEVNAGHSPLARAPIKREVAMNNIGQSLHLFVEVAQRNGYNLVCYNGNAFFIRSDANNGHFPPLSAEVAYQEFICSLSTAEREWLYLVNTASVPPYYSYCNPMLERQALGIEHSRAILLKAIAYLRSIVDRLRKFIH